MTPADLAVLRDLIEHGPQAAQLLPHVGKDEAAAAAILNTPSATLAEPAMMLESELMSLLSPASFAALFNHLRFTDMKRDIDQQNATGVRLWAQAFASLSIITPTEGAAVVAYTQRTTANPASPWEVAKGRGATVSGNDIANAFGRF